MANSRKVHHRKVKMPPPEVRTFEQMAEAGFIAARDQRTLYRMDCPLGPQNPDSVWDKLPEQVRDNWVEIAQTMYATTARLGGAPMEDIGEPKVND